MADLKHSFRQYMLYEPAKYSVERGNVRYMDGSDLNRPITMPIKQAFVLIVIIIIAAVIGYFILNNTIFESQRQQEAQTQATLAYAAADASVNHLPSLATVSTMDDASVVPTIASTGAQIYDIAAANGEEGVEFFCFPASVTLEEGTALYTKGISSLSADQATKILAGGYYLAVSHDSGTTVVARYADFTSGTIEAAMTAAAASQGIDAATATESGTDDAGNRYMTGTAELEGGTYTWRVSSLPLSDMYSVSGFPDNSFYVGIRMQS